MVKGEIHIKLNGKMSEIEEGLTLTDLLEKMKINPRLVACEVNQKIIKRVERPNTRINDGDEVEILQMIGGG